MAWTHDPNDPTHFVLPGHPFIDLDDEAEEEFRRYAREHPPERVNWLIYHPVCRQVWEERGLGV